jgi:fused signal recognition particle receptor
MGAWFQSLRKTRERFSGALKGLFAAPQPDEATAEELADLLVMADVPLRLVQSLSQELHAAASRREPLTATFRRVLVEALGRNPAPDWAALPAPTVALLVGINGSGKTTTAAKLARLAQRAGRKPLLGAADTFRAAGSHQLKLWADKLGANPAAPPPAATRPPSPTTPSTPPWPASATSSSWTPPDACIPRSR